MEFGILGPLRVVRDGADIDLGPFKQRALLALLVLQVGRVVSTDRILEELWGDDAAGKEQALWVYVSRLRSALEPERSGRGASGVLQTRDHGYVLAVDPASVDAVRAERLVQDARRQALDAPGAAAATFAAALDLWRGDALEDFAYQDFARDPIARLGELRTTAAEDRYDVLLRAGEHAVVVGEIESFQRRHPTRERPIAQFMLAAYRTGRHVDALRAYERFRRHVGEELGVVPSPELQRLEEQILLHDERLRPPPGTPTVVAPASVANPFKGLRPFDEADAGRFFGRERVVADVVRKIRDGARLITLVGPSGTGKSSILAAGVVTALRKDAIDGSAGWVIARMTPGAHPRAELEAALLRGAIDGPDTLADVLADEELGLLRAALRVLPDPSSRVVVAIDQLEELFTTTDPAQRTQFLDGLPPLVDDPRGRAVVLTAVRADFYDRLLEHGPFAERMASGIVNVVALHPDELERAMQEPLDHTMVGFDRALMATLIGDVVGRPASLPLFQYTLTELFDRSAGETLTLDSYRALGGVSGVIGATADRLLDGFTEQQRDVLRAVLLRLVTIEEGGQRARRRVEAAELLSLDVDVADLQRVIDVFGEHRLLSFDRAASGAPTVELAHEALLSEWTQLRTWIDEAHDDIRRRATLDVAIAEWAAAGRHPDFLPTGGRLAEYERWAADAPIALDAEERDFLQRAIARRDDDDHDAADRDRAVTVLRRRARRRTWTLVAVLVAIALVGAGALIARHVRGEVTTVAVINWPGEGDASIDQQINSGADAADRNDHVLVERARPLSDVPDEIGQLLASRPDLVIVPGVFANQVGFDVVGLARDHPDVRVVQLDGTVPLDGLPKNLTWLTFPVQDGAYLAGAAAALTSQTGRIGYIGGMAPTTEGFRAGFEAGARAVDPTIDISSIYPVGQAPNSVFVEPDLVRDTALDLYRQGVDVVFHTTASAGRGVAEAAAQETARTGRPVWAIGVDVDEWLIDGPGLRERVLTSLLKRHDLAITTAVDRFRDGTLPSGTFVFGLADGGMDLAESGDHLGGDVRTRIEQLRAAVVDGTIAVPDTPMAGPSIVPGADVTFSVTYDGTTCTTTAPPSTTLGDGDVIRVDLANTSSTPVDAGIVAMEDGQMYPYGDVIVAPRGTQVVTVRARTPHLGIGCFDGRAQPVVAEVTVPELG